MPLHLVDSTFSSENDTSRTHELILLSLAIRLAGIGIVESDLTQKRTRFSPELCDLLRLPRGTEVPYEKAWEFVHEGDRARLRAIVDAAAKAAEQWSAMGRMVRADGSRLWTSMCGTWISSGTLMGWKATYAVAVVVDVTHIREKDEALRESEYRLRLALEAAQMGTFEADINGAEAIIDAQEARLLGLPDGTRTVSREELRKRVPLSDVVASDLKEERLTQLREPYHHEFRMSMPDGSERWISARADVRRSRIFGVSYDITERKHLEKRARELTEKLVRIQEEERQKISQELHDSTAQHLAAVSLLLMNLRPRKLSQERRRAWDDCEASLQEALKELRSFSYLMHPPALEQNSFGSTVRHYIDGFCNRTGIRVDLRVNQRVDKLPTDALRMLLRLIQEGLSNIYRHSGAIHALIHLRQVGNQLHVVIKDNGRGSEGIEKGASFRPGRGIAGMVARVKHYEGRFCINVSPRGTTVHASIPMKFESPSDELMPPIVQVEENAAREKCATEEIRHLLSNIECEIRLSRRQKRLT